MMSVTMNDGSVYTSIPGKSPEVSVVSMPRFNRIAPTWWQWLMGATAEYVLRVETRITWSNVELHAV